MNGVYVLICRNPTYLKVVADDRTAKIFNEEERDHLSKLLITRFKNKDYDNGLLEGARYVQSALKGKTTGQQTNGAERLRGRLTTAQAERRRRAAGARSLAPARWRLAALSASACFSFWLLAP